MRLPSDFFTIVLYWNQRLSGMFKQEGLPSFAQYRVLKSLDVHGRRLTTGAIASSLRVTSADVTFLVRELRTLGLVADRRSEENLSRTIVSLTPEGEKVVARMNEVVRELALIYLMPLRGNQRVAVAKGITHKHADGRADHLAENLEDVFFEASALFNVEARRELNRLSLSVADYRILYELTFRDQGASPTDLARHLLVRLPTVSASTRGLRERGLVERRGSAADGRSVVVSITDAGRDVVDLATVVMLKILETHYYRASEDELELQCQAAANMAASERLSFKC